MDSLKRWPSRLLPWRHNMGLFSVIQKGKNAITGVDYENWHFRYVGVENAQYMAKHQLVLEEYIPKTERSRIIGFLDNYRS